MTDQAAPSGVVHLIDRQPQMTGTELLTGLVPPPQFDGATFDSYRSDPAFPSQEEAKQQLVAFATGAQPIKRGGLFRRAPKVPESKPGVYLDGGFDGYRLAFVETPSNPGLDICDIAAVAKAAHAAGALLIVDNTTMTPFGQRPLDLGADIVVAADTKAPNGHSDVLFGHVASRDPDIITAVQDWRKTSGCIPSPFDAWLVHRGLETLEVRFERMCASAGAIARRLQQHPAVRAVRYPGLENDPSHNLASAQMERFGFLVSLVLESEDKAEDFINGCALMQAATSFGGVHTSAERRTRRGDTVPPGFVRLSVGCEPTEPLWEAIKASLDRLGG